MENQEWRCPDHSKHCQAFEYTNKQTDEVKQSVRDVFAAVRDARKSIREDLEKLEDEIRLLYVTRAEYEEKNKVIFLAVAAILLKSIKDYLA